MTQPTVLNARSMERWREEFPILATSVYLVSHSLGAMPRSTAGALQEYTDLWASDGVVAWHRWLPMVHAVGDLVGGLIGAPPGSVIMGQNATNQVAAVASCFPYAPPRNRIVLAEPEFPTVRYFWEAQRRLGAEVVHVPGGDGLTLPLERLLGAIDERTLLVTVSHVLFKSAEIVDIAAVIQRAHAAGAYVLVDAYQSVGLVPFSVVDLDVDFLVGGSVKWLCGGPGAGYLYVKPSLVDQLEPAFCGWFSHEHPFAFDPPPIAYAAGIDRFMGGTPGVPALYTAREGYRIIGEVGVPTIRALSQRRTALIVERALADGLTVNSPLEPERRGGHVTVDFADAEAVSQELIQRRFIID
ncbi:MAG: aminotransferase class V-fold PLP-dependent enzyme, partial [Dehalococcoidia bacterium]